MVFGPAQHPEHPLWVPRGCPLLSCSSAQVCSSRGIWPLVRVPSSHVNHNKRVPRGTGLAPAASPRSCLGTSAPNFPLQISRPIGIYFDFRLWYEWCLCNFRPEVYAGAQGGGKTELSQMGSRSSGGGRGQKQSTSDCVHEKCTAAPQLVGGGVLPCPGSSTGLGILDRRVREGSSPSPPALPHPTSSHPLSISGPGVTELGKQEKMH